MSKISFKDDYNRLDEIVKELADDQKDIDESIVLFKEGVELYKRCMKKLEEAQAEVVKITKDQIEEPFDGEHDE